MCPPWPLAPLDRRRRGRMLCMDAPVTGDLYALQLSLAGELVALVDPWYPGPPVWPRVATCLAQGGFLVTWASLAPGGLGTSSPAVQQAGRRVGSLEACCDQPDQQLRRRRRRRESQDHWMARSHLCWPPAHPWPPVTLSRPGPH